MTTTINQSGDTRHHAGGMDDTTDPDPEVPERARGPRRFPAAYKARILAEYEGLSKAGLPPQNRTTSTQLLDCPKTPRTPSATCIRWNCEVVQHCTK
jgi:hypothetical protein